MFIFISIFTLIVIIISIFIFVSSFVCAFIFMLVLYYFNATRSSSYFLGPIDVRHWPSNVSSWSWWKSLSVSVDTTCGYFVRDRWPPLSKAIRAYGFRQSYVRLAVAPRNELFMDEKRFYRRNNLTLDWPPSRCNWMLAPVGHRTWILFFVPRSLIEVTQKSSYRPTTKHYYVSEYSNTDIFI